MIGKILAELGLDPAFPDDVEAEAAAWVAAPGIDDPALTDLSHIPFVTIDGAESRDLDQAMHLSTDATGFRLLYALADGAYYVRPGSALFREALKRGASYYAPGGVVTMLPRSLCEGVISLNPDVDRRALVFDLALDETAGVRETRVYRARVRSRAKLSWDMASRRSAFSCAGLYPAVCAAESAARASSMAFLGSVAARRSSARVSSTALGAAWAGNDMAAVAMTNAIASRSTSLPVRRAICRR